MNAELHSRHSAIIPRATSQMHVAIAGAGMTGSWTAIILARMVRHIDIWDFDTIEPGNLGVQAYTETQLGTNKAVAIEQITAGLPIRANQTRFPRTIPACDVLILCVDSMKVRREIATRAQDQQLPIMIDTRAMGELASLQIVAPGALTYDDYLLELLSDAEVPDGTCGATGTPFTGPWIGSQVAAAITSIGRGIPPTPRTVWHIGLNTSVAPV